MKKLLENDKKFLISQILLVILCAVRVVKGEKYDHAARLKILDDYSLSVVMTIVLCIAMFLLFMITLKCIDEKNKTKAFYVIMMVTIMMYPTYVHDNYLGTMDIYGLMIGAVSMVLAVTGFAPWISVVLMAVAVFVNPMCIFTMGVIVEFAFLYKALIKKEKSSLIIFICVAVVEVAVFFVSRMMGMFALDAQNILGFDRFIVILVFLLPFIFVAIIMYLRLIKKSDGFNDKVFFILSAFAGVPAFVVWTISGDYTRAIVNLFISYGFWLLIMLSYKDELVSKEMADISVKIDKWVPINGVIIIYIVAIMLYWMCGVEEIDTEKLIELVLE